MMAVAASSAGVLMIGAAGAGLAAASANAPNPIGGASGSAVEQTPVPASGGVAAHTPVIVTVGGSWSWDNVPADPADGGAKSSPQLKCADRYGVGWAVDWSDASTPYTISKNGVVFNVGRDYDGTDTNLCGSTAPDGAPVGTWTATHTYFDISQVPKVLCVNMYDMHGKQGQPGSASDFIAGGPGHDGDNSIETNAYNPAIGGNCFSTPPFTPVNPPPPANPTITVQKLNNAAGSGFGHQETATSAGENVPFQVTVTNTSSVPVQIDSISDAFGTTTVTPPECGSALVGKTLAPSGQSGDSLTCTFTENNYAPTSGSSVTNTFTVQGHNPTSGNQASGSDTSVVNGPPAPSQTIAASIVTCSGGAMLQGGTISVTNSSGSQVLTADNPLSASPVPPDTYTVSGSSLPAGWQFVSCGHSGYTIGSSGATASHSVPVSSGSSAQQVFYVAPAPAPTTQTLAGSILECGPDGNPLAQPVQIQQGSITVSANGTPVITSPNQLAATQVPAGSYTVSGSVPAGYQFVSCNQTGVTIASPSSASQPVTVNPGDHSQATFYVTPVSTQAQSISAAIEDCAGDLVQGGSLTVSNPANNTELVASANQLPATQVAAGTYLVGASAPSGFQFVTCPGGPPTGATATQTVTVPPGQPAQAVFFVAPSTVSPAAPSSPATQTVAATILACGPDGTPTTTPVDKGTLAILSGTTTLATASDQLPATSIPAGDYTASAAAPSGYQFVACGQSGVDIATGATSATQPLHVPSGSKAQATFYVTPAAVVSAAAASTPAPPAPIASPVPVASAAPSGTLAYTGPPKALQMLLVLGFSLLSVGFFALWATRPRAELVAVER